MTYTEPGTYNIFLTATDEESQCSDQSTAQIVVEEEDVVAETSFKLDLFPNPASDVLQVSCATAAEMVVRDAAGREVWRERMAAGRRSLDVSSWARGVYTMEVKPSLCIGHPNRTVRHLNTDVSPTEACCCSTGWW